MQNTKNATSVADANSNPLFSKHYLPDFNNIKAEHIVPAVKGAIDSCQLLLANLEKNLPVDWEQLLIGLEDISHFIHMVWAPVGHLHSVWDSPEIRTAHHEAQKHLVDFHLRLEQSEPIYKCAKSIAQGPVFKTLSPISQRMLLKMILGAEQSGVGLHGEQKTRFVQIAKELSDLRNKFSNNVLDAVKSYQLILKDKAEVEGLKDFQLGLGSQMYRQAFPDQLSDKENGPWLITLDYTSYIPFLTYSKRRDLRQQVYESFIQKASSGPFDNSGVIHKILALRQEEARLLGYPHFAALSLSTKMAENSRAVRDLLEKVRVPALVSAKNDVAVLQDFAKTLGFTGVIQPWDFSYFSELHKEHLFHFNEEQLKEYFPLDKTLKGLFALVENLFSVKIEEVFTPIAKWHADVRYFTLKDEKGKEIASFYLDPFSRPATKRGGAWMNPLGNRYKTNREYYPPVAVVVCNSTPPVGSQPALLTAKEVHTLFHEFGHALQHLLTTVDQCTTSGINGVEWDAVEICSQFLENFCYIPATLKDISSHYLTGEPLPDELINKLIAAKNYHRGYFYLRQIAFALADMDLHEHFDPTTEDVEAIFSIAKKNHHLTGVFPLHPLDKSLCAFSHVFAGGYSAGYYSYLWAETLSTDVFYVFKEVLHDPKALKAVGNKFRQTFLAKGGALHPMEVFKEFAGRDPDVNALLRENNLIS